MAVKISGLDKVLANLNKEISKIEGDISKGIILGAQLIKRDSIANTPVDTGNLKGSHYVVSSDGKSDAPGKFDTKGDSGKKVAYEHPIHVADAKTRMKRMGKPFVEVGCTAFYSEYVHEDMEASHVKTLYVPKGFMGPAPQGPIGMAKFLENSIKVNAPKVLDLVRRFAKR